MPTDLNNWTVPLQIGGVREVFDATNLWPGAPVNPAPVYVDINTNPFGTYQTGYDPVTGRAWTRYKARAGSSWTSWRTMDGGLAADAPTPTYAESPTGSTTVDVVFTMLLDPTSTPLVSAFTVTGKTVSAVLVGPSSRPHTCRLTINTALAPGAIFVGYTKPAPPTLKSVDAVDVATFANFAITIV